MHTEIYLLSLPPQVKYDVQYAEHESHSHKINYFEHVMFQVL
jgi:hypothetical protein